MNTTELTNETIPTLSLVSRDGWKLEASTKTDARISEVVDGKIIARSMKAARELAAEFAAMGFTAEAVGYGVYVVA